MKVGKEEIIGVLTAIETWARLDLDELNRDWLAKVESIAKIAESVPGSQPKSRYPREPTATPHWQYFGTSRRLGSPWRIVTGSCAKVSRGQKF